MGKYSKAFGAITGGIIGAVATYAAGKFGVPVEGVETWITAGASTLFAYFFPANSG